MLTTRKKSKVIKEHQTHVKDTGSADVQTGLLTKQIEELVSHLKKNPKDNHSRRGLLKMVGRRKKFLSYIKKADLKSYQKLVKKLGLKE